MIDWSEPSAVSAARHLLGWEFHAGETGGRIVEVEAYEPHDAASHSFNGPTPRTETMFGPAGHLYVYLSYGLHHLANVVVGPSGWGGAVLIRALEPLAGLELMAERRGVQRITSLCSGPGKLGQALGLGLDHDGVDLFSTSSPVRLSPPSSDFEVGEILVGPRIGISKDVARPWRFGLAGSPHLSRPF